MELAKGYINSEEVKMTLILAMKGSDGIVLASDSRGVSTDFGGTTSKFDTCRKINQISNYCVVATAGSYDIATRLLHDFNKENEKQWNNRFHRI